MQSVRLWDREYANAIDKISIEKYNISGLSLMEAAGRCVFEEILNVDRTFRQYLILAGPGNNGGDALVVAGFLIKKKLNVRVLLVGYQTPTPSCQHQHEKLLAAAPQIFEHYAQECFADESLNETCVIDGLCGLGFQGELRDGPFKNCLAEIKSANPAYTIAIDTPSGLDANTFEGQKITLPADLTITFGQPKPAHMVGPNRDNCGKVICREIGFAPEGLLDASELHPFGLHKYQTSDDSPFETSLKPSAHKFDRGLTLVIGGSEGKCGAPIMCGLAALRAGAGWATIALPKQYLHQEPDPALELTFESFFDGECLDQGLFENFLNERKPKSIVLGPGAIESFLTTDILKVLVDFCRNQNGFVVFDAGATNGLFDLMKGLEKPFPANRIILTPHPGEWQRLGASPPESLIAFDQLSEFLEVAKKIQCTLVHKGATPITFYNDRCLVNQLNDNSLAKAGSGDLIAGITAAMGGLGLDADEAFHRALQMTAETVQFLRTSRSRHSLIATDIITSLGKY